MKYIIFLLMVQFSLMNSFGQREFTYSDGDSTVTMKRYVIMLLNSGENRSQDSIEAMQIQQQHLAHLDYLAKTGKLIVAGPFEQGGEHRGLLIFDVKTVEEAMELEKEDPAVKTGRLSMETFYWWGAKGTCIN